MPDFALAKKMWDELGAVPTDEEDCTELPFYGFEPGTHREDIRRWFEDVFDLSVAEDLMVRR